MRIIAEVLYSIHDLSHAEPMFLCYMLLNDIQTDEFLAKDLLSRFNRAFYHSSQWTNYALNLCQGPLYQHKVLGWLQSCIFVYANSRQDLELVIITM